jgi:SNF2 family DNA or RNA helicase
MSNVTTPIDTNNSKYFAYYIPINSPEKMDDIYSQLKEYYKSQNYTGDELHKETINEFNTITNNIEYFDFTYTLEEFIAHNTNKLVLVKFSNLNDIFIKNDEKNSTSEKTYGHYNPNENEENIAHNISDTNSTDNKDISNCRHVIDDKEYILVNTKKEKTYDEQIFRYNIKTNNDYLFINGCEKNNKNYPEDYLEYSNTLNKILIETIVIPFASLRDIFKVNINDITTINNIEKTAENNILIKIFQIMNFIVTDLNYEKNTTDCDSFLPFKYNPSKNETNQKYKILVDLWNELVNCDISYGRDNFNVFNNINQLFKNYSIFKIFHNCNDTISTVKCRLYCQINITSKSFSDLTFEDAMPFLQYFTTNDGNITGNNKHNSIVSNISLIVFKINNLYEKNLEYSKNYNIQNPFDNNLANEIKNTLGNIQINILDDTTNNLDDTTNNLDDTTNNLDDTTNNLDDTTNNLDDTANNLDDTANNLDDTTNNLDNTLNNMQNINYPTGTTGTNNITILKKIKQNNNKIRKFILELHEIKTKLKKIRYDYKNHIFYQTKIGFKIVSEWIIFTNHLLYIRLINNIPVDSNRNSIITRSSFKYQYFYDYKSDKNVIKFYVSSDIMKNIISNNIRVDLFSLKKLFEIKIKCKYEDKEYNIDNYNHNKTFQIPFHNLEDNAVKTINNLINFINTNINVELLPHQKNNILWMLQMEKSIDNNKLDVPSINYPNNIDILNEANIIGEYLQSIKYSRHKSTFKKYIIIWEDVNYIIKIMDNITLEQSEKVFSMLNTKEKFRDREKIKIKFVNTNIINYDNADDNSNNYNTRIINRYGDCNIMDNKIHYTLYGTIGEQLFESGKKIFYSFDIIDSIVKETEYLKKNTISIPLCGGALCDDVGLGKTLSIIGLLVAKMKDDTHKYINNYNTKNGYEYNNLIIVPSRLTGQWESEIQKYIKNKFKLRVKVLATVTHIKNLEKELHEFYKNIKTITSKSPDANPHIIQLPTITDTNIKVDIQKKTREQIIIDRLMDRAKKQFLKQKKLSGISNDNNIITIDCILNNDSSKCFNKTELTDDTEFSFLDNYISGNINDNISGNINDNISDDKCSTESELYYNHHLYDIYIVSINLLSNDNYLQYIEHNVQNHFIPFNKSGEDNELNKSSNRLCQYMNKFNIFRIKWNRIILDEAHEKLIPVVKMFKSSICNYIDNRKYLKYEEQFLFENLANMVANYKWAITGTPTKHGIDNLMGILQFIVKRDISEKEDKKVDKIRLFSNLLGIKSEEFNLLLGKVFKKTHKTDIKKDLNIPIFTEEIQYVNHTNIERNIYNSIRGSRHLKEDVKIQRLFLMCTNILINEGYGFSADNDISTQILTLEELNNNMIAKFNIELEKIKNQKELSDSKINYHNSCKDGWQNIINYINSINDTIIANLSEALINNLTSLFGNFEINRTQLNCEVIYNLLDMFMAYQMPEKSGHILLENIENIRENIKSSKTKTIDYNNIYVMYKLALFGSQLGIKKNNEEIHKCINNIENINNEMKRIMNQIKLFSNNEFLTEKTADPCVICFLDYKGDSQIVITPCRHVFCIDCIKQLSANLTKPFKCPECRKDITCNKLNVTTLSNIKGNTINNNTNDNGNYGSKNNFTLLEEKLGKEWKNKCINKYGSKMAQLIEYLYGLFEKPENRVIIFSQYDKMLKMIGTTLDEFKIKYVYCKGNNAIINRSIAKFKKDDSIRIIMLSSETCNSGSNLTEANYIIFIDVLNHPQSQVKAIEEQAIGRAVRLGQKLPVKVVRFITRDTVEYEHFETNKYDMNTLQD